MKNNYKGVLDKLDSKNLQIRDTFKSDLKKQLFNGGVSMKKTKHLNVRELFKQRNFIYLGTFAAISLVAVSIFGFSTAAQRNANRQTIKDNLELAENLEGVLAIDQIREIALANVPAGATITSIELETEEGTTVYKVKYSDGSFKLFNAQTGVLFVKSEEVETDDSVPADFVAGITLQQARDIASAERPGKTITKIELETEEGTVVYSVRFSDGGRVDVSAKDGSVLRVRQADEFSSGSSTDDSNDDSQELEDESGDDNSGSNSGSGSSGSDDSNEVEESEEDNSGSGSGRD